MKELRIVFDGPSGHDGGRFVEVEDENGRSFKAGEWHERGDGLWDLRIPAPAPSHDEVMREALTEIAEQRLTEEMGEPAIDYADFEGGYDLCIARARAALQEHKP